MSTDERQKPEVCSSAFSDCLVEGNAEQSARERKIKRRALVISVALQTAGLAVLVIAPMLAKPPELVVPRVMPIPPYRHFEAQRHVDQSRPSQPLRFHGFVYEAPVQGRPISTTDRTTTGETTIGLGEINLGPGMDSSTGLLPMSDNRSGQPPPPPPVVEKKRISLGHIDPALLTHRVEPAYPALMRQLRRNGKVELHAVISTDGSIQSLQVVSGDPMFIQSALDAVQQWRYKPTFLDGRAVEVDTFITVIYTLQQ